MELDNSHPLAFGYPDIYFTLKKNGAIYDFLKDGWNVVNGEEIFYISNPGLGLWAHEDRFKQ